MAPYLLDRHCPLSAVRWLVYVYTCTEHHTTHNTQQRTPNTEHRTTHNTEHRTPNTAQANSTCANRCSRSYMVCKCPCERLVAECTCVYSRDMCERLTTLLCLVVIVIVSIILTMFYPTDMLVRLMCIMFVTGLLIAVRLLWRYRYWRTRLQIAAIKNDLTLPSVLMAPQT